MDTQKYLKLMENEHTRVEAQLQALHLAYQKRAQLLEEKSIELQQLQELLRRAVHRIRYAETLPGRRVPFAMNFEIEIPFAAGAGTVLTNPQLLIPTNVGIPYSNVQRVEKDGPFVATTYVSAFKLKTFSLGPLPGSPPEILPGTDPTAGTEIISPMTGRFRPIASTTDPFSGAYIGPGIGVLNVSDTAGTVPVGGGAAFVKTFRPGSIDFIWGVVDEGVERQRQNGQALIPSRFLYSDYDRPLYLPVSDYFERGASIRFNAQLLHDLGYIELSYAAVTTNAGTNTWIEAQNAETDANIGAASSFDSSQRPTRARRLFGLGGTLYFTMLGYKILQPMEPAV